MIAVVYILTFNIIISFEVWTILSLKILDRQESDHVQVLFAGYRKPAVHHQLPGGLQQLYHLPPRPLSWSHGHQEQVLLPQLVRQDQGGEEGLTGINVVKMKTDSNIDFEKWQWHVPTFLWWCCYYSGATVDTKPTKANHEHCKRTFI